VVLGMFVYVLLAFCKDGHDATWEFDDVCEDDGASAELDTVFACCELSHDWNWSGGRATTWKNISEW